MRELGAMHRTGCCSVAAVGSGFLATVVWIGTCVGVMHFEISIIGVSVMYHLIVMVLLAA